MNMFRESIINEASFSVKDLEKVAETYGKLFGREFGGTFYPIGVEWYKKSKESGQGVRMINEAGRMMRLNFSNRTSNFANAPRDFVVLSSIDFWEQGNTDDACPTTSCYFSRAVNVVKIWKKLGQLIRNGKAGKYKIGELAGINENNINEEVNTYTGKERLAFYKAKGLPVKAVRSKEAFAEYIEANSMEDVWEAFVAEIEPGKPEQNAFSSDVKKTQKALDEHKWCNPDTVFEEIELLTQMVIEGISKSFILCGMGGLGKTYHVNKKLTELLGESGSKWYTSSGKATSAAAFYDELFYARDKIFMCDEADSILKDKELIVMLKPVLDTSGKNTMEYAMGKMPCFGLKDDDIREYSDNVDKLIQMGVTPYNGKKGPQFIVQTEKGQKYEPWNRDIFNFRMGDGDIDAESITGYWVPSKFFFTGGIIFISNMAAKDIDQAIMSRSAFIDLWLTATDVAKRIKDILHEKYPSDYDLVEEVIDYLSNPERGKELTVRSGVFAMKIIKESSTPQMWKRLIQYF